LLTASCRQQIVYASTFVFYLELYLSKGALLALFLEVFGQNCSRRNTITLYSLSAFCIVSFFVTCLTVLFYCDMRCYWDPKNPCPSKCDLVKGNLGWALQFTSGLISMYSILKGQSPVLIRTDGPAPDSLYPAPGMDQPPQDVEGAKDQRRRHLLRRRHQPDLYHCPVVHCPRRVCAPGLVRGRTCVAPL
jgi:hypothetical protein